MLLEHEEKRLPCFPAPWMTTFFFVLCESYLGGLWAGESALRLTMECGQGVLLSGLSDTEE